ncbi:hypothetical protein B0J13DRAFT_672671 [Dactylonectria estremocensis]|uniref:Uncharacterized protein n=1 Tax=Dactylonectria estremocensis TaxID=1079267 RepID=A0A9P9F9A8_9HYPO|nr:hypothetical protein B0J13DRAFT_672671 [Dactylonectria estremocensis]
MALGQFEFTLLASVLVAYIIFTPEPLVLLRNLIAWALLTWLAWAGYRHWETSAWTRKLVTGFYNDRVPSTIFSLCWGEVLGTLTGWSIKPIETILNKCTGVGIEFANIFGWLRRVGLAPGAPTLCCQFGLGSNPSNASFTDTTAESVGALPRHKKYYAILVTTPPVHVYGPVSDHLHKAPDRPETIPWNATSTSSIPPILASLAFRRHFALCLVPTGLWESKTKTLAKKIDGQLFWDYSGDMSSSSRGAAWSPNRVSSINAIQELGIVGSNCDAIMDCTNYYYQLREDWKYFNIWWNDADFAIVLACLVDRNAVSICRILMRRRDELREVEVTMPRQTSARRATFMTFAAASGLMAVTGGLAAPVAVPLFAAAGASHFAQDVLRTGEEGRRDRRMASSEELQSKFPQLRQLFA